MINETNLTKLAFVLAANGGGSGSGSSSGGGGESGSGSSSGGGGVMVIGIDKTSGTPRLNKTYQEIFDCVSGGTLPVLMLVDTGRVQIAYIDGLYNGNIYAHGVSQGGTITQVTFTVDSSNDYPVMYTGDSGGSSGQHA